MWLLETSTLQLKEFFGANIPQYAILSHTWAEDEVSYLEMQEMKGTVRHKAGFKKAAKFCGVAKSFGYDWAWIDTCCIDKRSSAELTEAINSMYNYYLDARICIVYLADVPGRSEYGTDYADAQSKDFKRSRWFTRGWTLQELIASNSRHFFAGDWSRIPNAGAFGPSNRDLVDLVCSITGINEGVLRNRSQLRTFCVAERMSWAARRHTTRAEDRAYSLMGLFNVSMPILYGEGLHKAFRRLQLEIMQASFDQTLFAWRGRISPDRTLDSGLLARTPADFTETPQLGIWRPDNLSPFSMTNIGLSIRLPVFRLTEDPSAVGAHTTDTVLVALQCDIKTTHAWKILLIPLERVLYANCFVNGKRCDAYRRHHCIQWKVMDPSTMEDVGYKDFLILEDEHLDLLSDVHASDMARQLERENTTKAFRHTERASASPSTQ